MNTSESLEWIGIAIWIIAISQVVQCGTAIGM